MTTVDLLKTQEGKAPEEKEGSKTLLAVLITVAVVVSVVIVVSATMVYRKHKAKMKKRKNFVDSVTVD